MALSLLDPDEYHDAKETVGANAFLSNRSPACDLIPAIQRLRWRKPRRDMTAQDGRSMARILIVEDDDSTARVFSHPLRTTRHAPLPAPTGRPALLAARAHPDVILVDLGLPDISEDEGAVFEAVKNGAQGYVLKKAGPVELFDALRGILRGEVPLGEAASSRTRPHAAKGSAE